MCCHTPYGNQADGLEACSHCYSQCHDRVLASAGLSMLCCLVLLLLTPSSLLFAGNINQLILKVDSYARSLEETQGTIAEFVNPKYKDSSKTEFRSSTRLECMMQDYPKALPSTAAVGFTVINQVRYTQGAEYAYLHNLPSVSVCHT